eukprot:1159568-Pelagomonas_calceolata.AAC.7
MPLLAAPPLACLACGERNTDEVRGWRAGEAAGHVSSPSMPASCNLPSESIASAAAHGGALGARCCSSDSVAPSRTTTAARWAGSSTGEGHLLAPMSEVPESRSGPSLWGLLWTRTWSAALRAGGERPGGAAGAPAATKQLQQHLPQPGRAQQRGGAGPCLACLAFDEAAAAGAVGGVAGSCVRGQQPCVRAC